MTIVAFAAKDYVVFTNDVLYVELAVSGQGAVKAFDGDYLAWHKSKLAVKDASTDALDVLFYTAEWFRGRGFRTRFAELTQELWWWQRLEHRIMFYTCLLIYRMRNDSDSFVGPPRHGGGV